MCASTDKSLQSMYLTSITFKHATFKIPNYCLLRCVSSKIKVIVIPCANIYNQNNSNQQLVSAGRPLILSYQLYGNCDEMLGLVRHVCMMLLS